MASSVSGSEVPDGPVLTVLTKRLRALKKKYNRILSMEQTHLAGGKPLNEQQSELLSSKPVVAALIDEYEKLRQPLVAAVQEELSGSSGHSPPPSEVEDLLGLLYFASLFDVKPQSEFTSTMLTRAHERSCCLTYDYVTDDATELLGERDLDLIAAAGGMMVSRPVYSGVSHRDALEGCVRHAGLWLRNADEPVGPDCDLTYAGLREKLKKIMASDYFTTTPEMKAPVDVAAVVGKYGTATGAVQVEGQGQEEEEEEEEIDCADPAYFDHKDDELEDVQATEASHAQSNPVDESLKDEAAEFNSSEEVTTAHQEQETVDVDSEEQNQGGADHKEQQQYVPRRQYQNQKGGGRGGSGRRGYYANGRGGRGGRGGGGNYQNGRGQQYYESGNYPRNYYNGRGRGGGRPGGSSMYNSNHGAPTHDSRVEADS
ncbi:putative heterogeneous nuclear ribonucleoprotein A1, A2/B1-like protein [Iris pallida]|uniref:Heterogeneous nuclear ribonucleoprotein A1, A2/B1-like protein n=1 Tax=Iris pallida TaxID=29817 RepID=A0AAX6ET32_IRIPA|nr:putative heterogeneous nuclear ribonucleoprotein A1, A2/B1-like protein [Iris pallida]